MDFVLATFAGDPVDAVVELTRPVRDHSLVLVFGKKTPTETGGAALWSHRQAVSSEVVHGASNDLPVVSADLRRIVTSAHDLSNRVTRVGARHSDIVAIRDGKQWNRKALVNLIETLQGNGKRVVLFTDVTESLGDLATLDAGVAVVADYHDQTLVVTRTREYWSNPVSYGDAVSARRELRFDEVAAALAKDVIETPTTVGRAPTEEEPARAEPSSGVRNVNSLVVEPGGTEGVDVSQPLAPGTHYEVLVDIGPYRAGSLLADPDSRWPAPYLPGGDLALSAVLTMSSAPPLVKELTLPAEGSSDKVRFPITTPDTPTVWTGELVIYYQVVPVHAQQLVLPVGAPTADGLHAQLLYQLTRAFTDLDPLADRTAGVLVTDGGARALINGLTFADNPVAVAANRADNAVRAARELLYRQHLTERKGGLSSKLDANYGKTFADFHSDLANLARQGATIYNMLFRDNTVFDTLPELIRAEAAARGRPAVITVADPSISDPERDHPVPWALVYDLRISQEEGEPYRLCDSLRRFGPGGTGGPVPAHCPEPNHTGNVLCPFGFWGLSCVIEQPVSAGQLVWTVLEDSLPASVTMAIDPGLDPKLTKQHREELTNLLGKGTVTESTVTSPQELATALAGETMDIAYLYCHGGYHKASANARPSATLRFGESFVDPVEVSNWRRDATVWPRPHWPRRKPLVVMNGCHTAELTTATLANFVDAFANRAGASGVIGTEITVEQGMAGWAMEQLLHRLVSGDSIGDALRTFRWRLLGLGNVIGLAYTPYCVAGLRLRPPTGKD